MHTNIILQGNALEVLETIPDCSVQCCISSPPYFGLRSYLPDEHPDKTAEIGLEETPQEYITKLVQVFRQVRRVLRPDGTCWINLGDSYANDTKWGGSTSGKHAQALHGENATRGRKNTNLPPKSLIGMPWRVAFALQDDGWILRSDIIWNKPNCLSESTVVYARTQKGDMPIAIKELVQLCPETVKLWNGQKWTQALQWIQRAHPGNPIELELQNGQRINCTPEHVWPTQQGGNVRADELQIGDRIQMCQLPEPCNSQPVMLPDDIGWFIGMYLAEGSRSGDTLWISCHKKEIESYERLYSIAENYGTRCRKHSNGNQTSIHVRSEILTGLIDTYIREHEAHEKQLSRACWAQPNTFLHAVLAGYLAGAGHYDDVNTCWRIGYTRNYNLENDIRTLCARLGLALQLKPTSRSNKGMEKELPLFNGEIQFTRGIHFSHNESNEIVAIGRSRARTFWDIAVEDDPHLFALASGVLTHNCMPSSVTDRPTTAHEHIFLLVKSERYYYDCDGIREPHESGNSHLGNTWEQRKANGAPSRYGLNSEAQSIDFMGKHPLGRNKRSVWSIAESQFKLRDDLTLEQKAYVVGELLRRGCL